MAPYDIVQSITDHPGLHVADFWPSLLFLLSNPVTGVADADQVDLAAETACAAGATPAADTLTLRWAATALHSHRSDTLASARSASGTLNATDITEQATIGLSLCALPALCPGNCISRVSQIGTRADYYMNGRTSEMIEIGGSNDPTASVSALFTRKEKQILQGRARSAWVLIANFATRALRLEKVR